MTSRLSVAVFLVIALGTLPAALGGASPVSANGAARPVVQDARAGPYQLQVSILPGSPKVGNLHLSIQVEDAANETIITDAAVLVAAQGPAGAANVGPLQAVTTLESPQSYEVDIPLDTVGRWTVTLETDSRLGQASLDIPLDVTEPDGLPVAWLAAGLAAALALVVWTWRRTRRR